MVFIQSALFFSQQNVTNQNLFDTTTFMEDHFVTRVSQFEKDPVEAGKVIFLGDSITECGEWNELPGNGDVVNRGVSGDITFGVIKRFDDIVVPKPAKLFILIGINDIGKDIPDEVIADNCRKIVKHLQTSTPLTQIYLQSILPVNPDFTVFPQYYDKEYHIIHTNYLLQAAAKELNCYFINLFPVFMDKQQHLRKELSTDELLLNEEGYGIWIKYLSDMGYLDKQADSSYLKH